MLDPWALNHSRWKKKLAGWLYENRNLRHAACLHALCESEYQSIRAYGLRNPVCILPNGVELPAAAAAHPQTLSLQQFLQGRKLLLFLSRLHPKKGLENLIRAWSQTLKNTPGIEEWILGIAGWDQGGHEQQLKTLADELGFRWSELGDWATDSARPVAPPRHPGRNPGPVSLLFLGPAFQERKDALFRNCSAFILPSFSEGMPVAVLEAWSYGKPVLMTPACNLPEGFAAGAALQVLPSVESIRQGLHDLITMPDAGRIRIGARGRQLVEEKFTWPEIARQMKSVYDWLLGGGAKPNCVVTS